MPLPEEPEREDDALELGLEDELRPPPFEAPPPALETFSFVALLADANPFLEPVPSDDEVFVVPELRDEERPSSEEERPPSSACFAFLF